MIRLDSPQWLVLAPLVILAAWRWPVLGLTRPLRAALTVLLLVLMAGPQIKLRKSGLDLWVLTDRSASCADLVEPRVPEVASLLDKHRRRDDRVHWLDYADVAQPREGTALQPYTGTRCSSKLATALHHVLSHPESGRATRVLALTDGYSTEPLDEAAVRMAEQRVPLDFRLFPWPTTNDLRVTSLDAPPHVRRGEPFLIEALVEGTPDGSAPYLLWRGQSLAGTGTVAVSRGRALLRLSDRLDSGGVFRYAVEVRPAGDMRAGNNRAEGWVEVQGGPRVALVTSYQSDPLAAPLARAGWDVDVIAEPEKLDPGRLAGARCVIFNNVPAYRLNESVLKALDFQVRMQGSGFIMAGGRFSFGSGGYFESAVDSLLPVSMELKKEQRKLVTAMAIVLDRSGSMSVTVPGGQTKIALADEGAARSVELLGERDAVSVIAVDSSPHVVVSLCTVGENRGKIISNTRRIASEGGGIFVYTGLKAAWKQIRDTSFGQKHIVLFADAADAEEPGDYKTLLAEIVAAGGTVSVIGLGTEQNCDAEFLKDVAARGGGRIFFTEDAATLPAVFAQETVAVSRSAFLKEPVAYKALAGWSELASRPLPWLASVDGYNLSYLREGASVAAVGRDEYQSPLVAFWQRGMGRVAAVSFPLGGEYSDSVRAWPAYEDFARTLVRWAAGADLPPGIGLRTTLLGSVLQADLLYDASWEQPLSKQAPRMVVAEGAGGDARPVTWQRMEPGRFSCRIPLDGISWLRGAVQLGQHALPFGPVSAGGDAEWRPERSRVEDLRAASARTGGEERLDLASIWSAPRIPVWFDLRPWGLVASLLLFLLEAAVTRLGLSLRRARGGTVTDAPRAAPAVRSSRPVTPKNMPAPDAPERTRQQPVAPPSPSSSRRSVFNRAKKGPR